MEFLIALPWADISLWTLAALCVLAGFAGMVMPAIPGPPLLFIGLMLAAWAEDFVFVGAGTLTLLAAMAVAALVLDAIAGALGAKRYGASPTAVTGALIGAVLGIFMGPIGIIVGPLLGAMVGELLMGRSPYHAGRAGIGATVGMLMGIVAKVVIGIIMICTFLLVRIWD